MVWIGIICFLLIVVGGSLLNGGLPTCLSDIYYRISAVFTVLMVAMAICFLPSMLEVTQEDFQFLAFLCCGGIMFVGVAPNYKDELEGKVHKASALVSCFCSVAWVTMVAPWNLLLTSLLFIAMADKKRWLFWFELLCFIMVIATMLEKC